MLTYDFIFIFSYIQTYIHTRTCSTYIQLHTCGSLSAPLIRGSELRRRADRGSNCSSRLAWGSRESLGLGFRGIRKPVWALRCTVWLRLGTSVSCFEYRFPQVLL